MCLWAFVVYAKLSPNWMFYNNSHWLSSRFCTLAVWDLFSRVFRRASPALIPSAVTTGHWVALVLEVTGCQTWVCGGHVYVCACACVWGSHLSLLSCLFTWWYRFQDHETENFVASGILTLEIVQGHFSTSVDVFIARPAQIQGVHFLLGNLQSTVGIWWKKLKRNLV